MKGRYISFKVEPCNLISLFFFKREGYDIFEVYINNQNKNGSEMKICYPADIHQNCSSDSSFINCDPFMDIWVSWNDTTIEVGHGTTTDTKLFLTNSPDAPIPTIDELVIESEIPIVLIFQFEKVS